MRDDVKSVASAPMRPNSPDEATVSDHPGPPRPFPPPPSDSYPPPPPPPPSPTPPFQPGGGPRQERPVWAWVVGGVALLLLVVAGVMALTEGDDEASTVTAERDTTSSELPSTTTTRESPSTTTTSEPPSTIETAGGLLLEELRVGDCFNDSGYGTPEVGEITRVDCSVPHDSEVFGVPTLPGDPGAPYPGDDEIDRLSGDLCLHEFASYVGIDFEDSMWEFDYFGPLEETWRAYNDRLVICALTDPSFNKLEGSKRNSRT